MFNFNISYLNKFLSVHTVRLLLPVLINFFSQVTFADDDLLTPIEEYRDFIPFGPDPTGFSSGIPENRGFTKILFADSVAAHGNDIFVADNMQRKIFLIHRGQHTLSEFAVLNSSGKTDLYIAPDLSLYVINKDQQRVIQYERDGRIITKFQNNLDLVSPVAVTVSDITGNILIADNARNHISVFNRLGAMVDILGKNINMPDYAGSIAAMASAGEFIYLLDNQTREVMVLNYTGEILYRTGKSHLKQPVSLAIDSCYRIFVADQFDNSIYIFQGEELTHTYKNMNPGLSGLTMITDLWIDNNQLFVADGPTGMVKVFLIENHCQ